MKYLIFISIFLPLALTIDDNNDVLKLLYNYNRLPEKDPVAFDKGYIQFYNKYEDVLSGLRDMERYGGRNYDNQAGYDFRNYLEPHAEDTQSDITRADSGTVKKWFGNVLPTAKTAEHTQTILMSQNEDYKVKNVAQLLFKLTDGIELLNDNLAKINSAFQTIYGEYVSETPTELKRAIRSKRDLSNDTSVNSTKVVDSDKKDYVASTKSDGDANLSNQTGVDGDGRRMNPFYQGTPNVVKGKLLAYLDKAFLDLQRKILPIDVVKATFSSDTNYKIGYVVAILDTLEANLKKLKADADYHKQLWDNAKILELFDKLKVSNNVVTGLLVSLQTYIRGIKQYV